ncbi:MAG: hypothetical protein J5793_00785 [Clostridia bacterium]|nr:hypothetical protein [Clostridia bacterium]
MVGTEKTFKGIDERVGLQHGIAYASAMKNFRVDAEGALVKRPDAKLFAVTQSNEIDGIWKGRIGGTETAVVVSGGELFTVSEEGVLSESFGFINAGKCAFLPFDSSLYILNGVNYFKFDGSELSVVTGYVPIVAVSCEPDGSGTAFEQLNLLNDGRRQLFNGSGTDTVYHLSEQSITAVVHVTVDGIETDAFTVDLSAGTVTFTAAPARGINNIMIEYRKSSGSQRNRIARCRHAMKFGGNSDGRLFLWGNGSYPNYRFHSEMAEGVPSAEYFPVNNFTVIGDSAINTIVQQYDKQLIFTKDRAFYSFCELKEDSLGNVYSSFPVYNLNSKKGSLFLSDGCIIGNSAVTVCEDGINVWESTNIENEKNALCISDPVKSRIREALEDSDGYNGIVMFDYQCGHELFFIFGGSALIYNYSAGVWYEYGGFNCESFFVSGYDIYFSYLNKIYILSENGSAQTNDIECVWECAHSDLGVTGGRFDVTGFEADVNTLGACSAEFTFGDRFAGKTVKKTFTFTGDDDGHKRISIRPHLRRAMPLRVKIKTSGHGECRIFGIRFIIKKRERSNKNVIQ